MPDAEDLMLSDRELALEYKQLLDTQLEQIRRFGREQANWNQRVVEMLIVQRFLAANGITTAETANAR